MSDEKRSRGRPKGSGIDDHDKLMTIGRMISRSPGLKPTTAIRQLGITDPSTIRRLRDKYKASRLDIQNEVLGLPRVDQMNDNTLFRLPTEAARQSLLRTTDPIRRSTPREVVSNSRSRTEKRNELSCLLAIGAHALAQAAQCCRDLETDSEDFDGAPSQDLLAQMLFMISSQSRGDGNTAR